jgi:hypothetical protein
MGLLDEIIKASNNPSQVKGTLENSPAHTLTGRGAPQYQNKVEGWKYDGLTSEECLALYEQRQRESGTPVTMTRGQIKAAQGLWAALLAEKKITADARRRARETTVQVTLDPDDL